MDTNVLFWIGGGLIGLAGLALLWWALFADRSYGRRRCPKCWYDMSKTEGLRCPECGRNARREPSLHRTRRKWKWAAAAPLILLAAATLALQPKVQRDGWASVAPATILILALNMNDPQWALDGLQQRVEVDVSQTGAPVTGFGVTDASTLHGWQWRMIAPRCIAIVDSSMPAATRTAAIGLLTSAEEFVTVESDANAIQDAYWRHALDPNQRIHSISVLSLSGDRDEQRAMSRLRQLLGHDNPQVRGTAVTGLRLMLRNGSVQLAHALLETLDDGDRQVRMLAMGALSAPFYNRDGSDSAVFDRVLTLLSDSDAGVRRATIARLPNFVEQHDRAMTIFQEKSRCADEALRAGVLDGLASMEKRPEWAVEAALSGLTDESPDVQQAAAWLLEVTAVDALRPHIDRLAVLLDSSHSDVARAVTFKVDQFRRAIEANR